MVSFETQTTTKKIDTNTTISDHKEVEDLITSETKSYDWDFYNKEWILVK